MLCKNFESCMKKEFEMSTMGELNYFLGLQIKQRSDGIFIQQAKYTRELIKKLGLEDAKTIRLIWLLQQSMTRMIKVKMLTLNSIKVWLVVCFIWRLVGRILCLVFIYVLDSNLVLKNPTWLRLTVKRIIRYLKGTIGMDLWYPKTGQFSRTSFSDADYTGCRVDRKSTSETC